MTAALQGATIVPCKHPTHLLVSFCRITVARLASSSSSRQRFILMGAPSGRAVLELVRLQCQLQVLSVRCCLQEGE